MPSILTVTEKQDGQVMENAAFLILMPHESQYTRCARESSTPRVIRHAAGRYRLGVDNKVCGHLSGHFRNRHRGRMRVQRGDQFQQRIR